MRDCINRVARMETLLIFPFSSTNFFTRKAMPTSIYHNHHIIPKHVFKSEKLRKTITEEQFEKGVDHPENLIKLTIPEHAEAHRLLYEEYGRWQDELAWKFLSRQIIINEAGNIGYHYWLENGGREELSLRSKGDKNVSKLPEVRNKISKSIKALQGIKCNTPESISKRLKTMSLKSDKELEEIKEKQRGPRGKQSKEWVDKRKLTGYTYDIDCCPHCNTSGGGGNMKRYHFDNCKEKKNE